jgi:hypothetical protein
MSGKGPAAVRNATDQRSKEWYGVSKKQFDRLLGARTKRKVRSAGM